MLIPTVLIVSAGFAVRSATDKMVPIHRFDDIAVVQLYPPFTFRHLAVFPIRPMSRTEMSRSIKAINGSELLQRGEAESRGRGDFIRFIAYAMPDYDRRGVTVFDIGRIEPEDGPIADNDALKRRDISVEMIVALAVDHRSGELLGRRNHFEGAYLPMAPIPGGVPINLSAGHVHPTDY